VRQNQRIQIRKYLKVLIFFKINFNLRLDVAEGLKLVQMKGVQYRDVTYCPSYLYFSFHNSNISRILFW